MPDTVSLVSVVGKHYGKNDDVSLDNYAFSNCSADECNLGYSGGPGALDNCRINKCQLSTQGAPAILAKDYAAWVSRLSPPLTTFLRPSIN